MTVSSHSITRYCSVLLLAFGLVACSEPEQQQTMEKIHTVAIRTVQAASASALGERHFIGIIEPVSTVDISFQITGKMTQLPVKEGTVVPKDGLLAALDPAEFKSAVREAEVAVDVAHSEFSRKKTLLDKGLVSPEVYEQALSTYDLRKVALDNAERNLSYTRIYAPFDALITRRLVDAHTNVQARDPVLRIQDVSELRVRISVPEELMRMSVDRNAINVRAQVMVDGREYIFPLEYREHSTEADQVAQSYGVVFGMPRPEQINLLPGMTISVVVDPLAVTGATTVFVPVGALDDSAGTGIRVWVYDDATGKVSARPVTVGPVMSGYVTVIAGLEEGEQVVSAGVHALEDGMQVQPLRHLR